MPAPCPGEEHAELTPQGESGRFRVAPRLGTVQETPAPGYPPSRREVLGKGLVVDRSRLLVARGMLALGLVLGLILGVAGCSGDDPEPRVEPSGSGTPSASVSTSPETMTPKQTVRAWVDAQNEALVTGDTTRVRELECGQLSSPAMDSSTQSSEVYAAGGQFKTRGGRSTRLTLQPRRQDRAVVKACRDHPRRRDDCQRAAGEDPVTYRRRARHRGVQIGAPRPSRAGLIRSDSSS